MAVTIQQTTVNTTVAQTLVKVTVAVSPSPSVTVAQAGPQGAQGIPGPSGPTGPVAVPNFYESSSPPVGPDRGDQWIVTSEIG